MIEAHKKAADSAARLIPDALRVLKRGGSMNAPMVGAAREAFDNYTPTLDDERRTKARLAIAGRIAGGMAGNPHACEGRDWQGEIARASWAIAGKLLTLADSGGC